MRAPAFWWRERSLLTVVLRPASAIYGTVAGFRMRRSGVRADVPVICVGNFTAGGAGKTPTVLTIAGLLRSMGETPAFLSRGYGGSLRGPVLVTEAHTAAEVGDEPLLLARSGTAIVSRDRVAGAALAASQRASVVVMDDGFQNPSIAKDLAVAVVDGASGIGNGLPLPAGPLRAPMATQWSRTDAVIVIGEGAAGDEVAMLARERDVPILRGRLVPEPASVARLRGRHVLAFAGIGRPQKFFETLEQAGAIVEDARPFPDHHPYTQGEIAALQTDAKTYGLHLVTTEKDAVRLEAFPARQGILTLPVHLQVDAPETLRSRLGEALARRRAQAA